MAEIRYYRVKRDTPLWVKGAILKWAEGESGYVPIHDLWDYHDNVDGEYLSRRNVEKNPDWFERVYETSAFGKAVYVSKEKAQQLATKFFNGKKDVTTED